MIENQQDRLISLPKKMQW